MGTGKVCMMKWTSWKLSFEKLALSFMLKTSPWYLLAIELQVIVSRTLSTMVCVDLLRNARPYNFVTVRHPPSFFWEFPLNELTFKYSKANISNCQTRVLHLPESQFDKLTRQFEYSKVSKYNVFEFIRIKKAFYLFCFQKIFHFISIYLFY